MSSKHYSLLLDSGRTDISGAFRQDVDYFQGPLGLGLGGTVNWRSRPAIAGGDSCTFGHQ